jgi:hypothetical protein
MTVECNHEAHEGHEGDLVSNTPSVQGASGFTDLLRFFVSEYCWDRRPAGDRLIARFGGVWYGFTIGLKIGSGVCAWGAGIIIHKKR